MFGRLKLDLPGMDWPLGVPDLDEYMYQKESPFSGTGPWLALSDPTSDAAHGKFAEVDGKSFLRATEMSNASRSWSLKCATRLLFEPKRTMDGRASSLRHLGARDSKSRW